MKTEITKKTLSDNLRIELEKLQNRNNGKIEFTVEKNKLLLEFWPVKKHDEISEIFGCSIDTLRRQYKKLYKIKNDKN